MVVPALNPDTQDLEKSYLSAYAAEGSTSITVKNNDRFIATRPALIGRLGDERTEIVIFGTINANKTTVAVSATKFAHNADDLVYLLDFDEVNFYRMNSIDGTPVLLHTETLDVDNADKETRWDDTTGTASHYYQVSYSNSVTDEETELSDPVRGTGYDLLTAGNVIDQVVRRVRDQSYNILGIDEYLDIMNEVGSDMITQAHRPYDFLRREVELNTVAGQAYIDFPDKLWKFYKVFVATTSGNYQRFDELEPLAKDKFQNRYDNNQGSPQDNITDIAIDEESRRFLIYPEPKTSQTGVVKVMFYKTFDNLDDVGAVIETPNQLIYRYKLMAEFFSAKSEVDAGWARLAEKYESKYGNEIVKMQRTNRIDTGTPRSMMPRRMYRRRRYHL